MTDDQPRTRRRERRADNPRNHRVNLAYNDVELAALQVAATHAGLRLAAYAARAALAVAKEEISPAPVEYKDLLRTLSDARTAANRIGVNLNQIARVLNSEGEEPPERMDAVLARVEAAIQRLDEATVRIMTEQP
ncbi:plasmid mobilization relaxosome protein MobC [Streptomyces sp. IB2014 011-1]|uniref:plasmid mobilization relaxosome protein MobC n=1 Tax=Streptomyces sp. IB2014 011-1 TaxID=1844478 RepID=UPI000978E2E0|nr:plasmid mobilization relaxosome protein MobC [Streptomyces sp. IB2014 011-1]ONI48510.1 Bacterial mobilization protein (MobC) [Streptomyces sp. IB2014 011-1]